MSSSPCPGLRPDLWRAPSALAQDTQRLRTDKVEVIVETVARNLQNPWGLAFLPDGRMLVTERPGRLRIADADGSLSEPLQGVPRVAARGQGGLLDVALDPNFAQNRLVYLSFAEDRGEGRAGTSVARGRLSQNSTALEAVQVIFRQATIPATTIGARASSSTAAAPLRDPGRPVRPAQPGAEPASPSARSSYQGRMAGRRRTIHS